MSETRDPIPPLRLLDCTLINTGKEKMVLLRDRLGISPDAAVPLPLFALAQLFNGERTVIDIQTEIVRQTGEIFLSSDLNRIIEMLDQACFLDSPRFRERREAALREWNEAPVRSPTHAGEGLCYPDGRDALEREMEAIYRRPGSLDPAKLPSGGKLRAVLAPHIDFHRGGHIYTWAYGDLRSRGGAPVYVILGTSHQGMAAHFSVTRKGFATPWGVVPADGRFIDLLERDFPGLRGEDEFHHKREHSIEFQVVFLRHALGEREFSMVPILCGGFHEAIQNGVDPSKDPKISRFFEVLAGAIDTTRSEGREVILIGGVDLAHVGQHFGDPDRLDPDLLARVRSRDGELLEAVASMDPRRVFDHVASDGDRRHVCGFGPIYTILETFERLGGKAGKLRGEILAYDQAVDLEQDCCVTFASVSIDER